MEKKILIVGSGIAGLTAGILLLKKGYACEIFEKNSFAGGNLCGWTREGFTIDNCLHWLTGTRKDTDLHTLWNEIGLLDDSVEIRTRDAFYASSYGGKTVFFAKDPEVSRRMFRDLSPEDKKETDRFFDTVEKLADHIEHPTILTRLRLASSLPFYLKKDLAGVAHRFRSPLLRNAFTDLLTGEYSSLGLLFAYAAFVTGNADLPAGGSPACAKRVLQTFLSLGGVFRPDTGVTKLLFRDGNACSVVTEKGVFSGDGVILACDPDAVFGKLLPASFAPAGLVKLAKKDEDFPVYSAFQAAFCVPTDALPFHGTLGIPISPLGADGKLITRLTLREFSHEPGFAPEGKTVLQVLIFLHSRTAKEWIRLWEQDRPLYREKKSMLVDAVQSRIEASLPALSGKLSLLDAWTPATYRRYFHSKDGSFMSPALTGKCLPAHVCAKVKGLSNVFLAGQWYVTPGGLPSAAKSGKNAAKMLANAIGAASRAEPVPFPEEG